ncbi:MAG: TetR/AcrR family transcriptional regulator [Pseudomonadota bacterium]|nr:TetR/AcrR family transcriptional regulator [Pseudomonadota bacterium]
MSTNSKEAILAAAKAMAQAHGYGGLNVRDLARDVGISAPSIYHHFASKADLAAAVARRYREDARAALEALSDQTGDPGTCLRLYPEIFRKALETGNRICLCSFMAAEYDDLPDPVRQEIHTFADVNVAWLSKTLAAAGLATKAAAKGRAEAVFSAVAGAQLIARSRADVAVYDRAIDGYRTAGLLPK